MTATQEKELIQIYRDADDTGKALMWDLLRCFVYGGEDFIQEIRAVEGDKEAMKAVIAKWAATVREGEAV